MHGLLTNPQVHSAKLVNDSPGASQFKRERTVTAMQQMLSQMCCAQTPAAAPSSGVHVHALAQQLIDASGTDALPSGMIEPNVPSINFESAGKQPLGTTSHGLVMPTSNTMPTLEQQPQNSPLMNQLMDMILSLQNQMQMQQEAATRSKEQSSQEIPKKSRKRSSNEHDETTATSTSAQAPVLTKEKGKGSNKKQVQKKADTKAKATTLTSTDQLVRVNDKSSQDATAEDPPRKKSKKQKKKKK